MMGYQVLLYYCYTPLVDPEQFREEHHLLCLQLHLKGRIIIAPEGINGTVSGLKSDCEKYMQSMKNNPLFASIDFKVQDTESHVFTKLYVRTKPEIVHSDLLHIDPNQKTGIHLKPSDFKKMKDEPDVLILDVRSEYEHKIGKFKNAYTLDIENFRDFPSKMKELEKFRDKKIITYCTGGIKCEKASAYLIENGFEQVYQLEGGIIKYAIEEKGEDFEGKCYVFDDRVVVDVNEINPKVISRCFVCSTECDRMVNCANPECNEHVPICEKCGWEMEGACSEACRQHPNKRDYDGTGSYKKELNGYNPYLNVIRRKKTIAQKEEND